MKHKSLKHLKRTLLTLLALFVVVFANGCYFVFCHQDKSMDKILAGKGLNLYECCSVYTMHMATWMFGWPVSPAAAKECFMLHFPHKDTVRLGRPSKFSSSEKICKAVERLQGMPVGTSVTVAWHGDTDYALRSKERYAAIALNACKVIKVKDAVGEDGFRSVAITSPMIYPEYSRTKFDLGKITIVIHEGLFRYLQDRGWLSKFIAVYNFKS